MEKNSNLILKFLLAGSGLILLLVFLGKTDLIEIDRVDALTNIHSTSTDHWAWNDIFGWIDFYGTDSVEVKARYLEGYASSSLTDVSLNCNERGNSSGINHCSSDYKVINNGIGGLSGWAWNDAIGWISFCGTDHAGSANSNCPLTQVDYDVDIVTLNAEEPPSDFQGWAWNEIVGWISFNCINFNCGASNFKVTTDWYATSSYADVYSSVFDTGIALGAQFNSASVVGRKIGTSYGTGVVLQFATDCLSDLETPPNCSSWKFLGPDNTANTFYQLRTGLDSQIFYTNLERKYHYNDRYFRYRLRLKSNSVQDTTPIVDDVIINWSP